jgi:hypothetical protein
MVALKMSTVFANELACHPSAWNTTAKPDGANVDSIDQLHR